MEQDMDLSEDTPALHKQFPTFNIELFFDHVYNAGHDIFEDCFDTLEENAPLLLGNHTEEMSKATTMGFDAVFNTVQEKLEKHLNRWEVYCRANCFSVPKELPSFQEEQNHLDGLTSTGTLEKHLDAELESVRSQLYASGKDSGRMRRELRNLERFLIMKKKREEALQDAVIQINEDSHQNMVKELLENGNLLKEKLSKLRSERIQSPRGVRWSRSNDEDLNVHNLKEAVQALNF